MRCIEDIDKITSVEPEIAGLAAVHSPAKMIADWLRAVRLYVRKVAQLGGRVLWRHEVTEVQLGNRFRIRMSTSDGDFDLCSTSTAKVPDSHQTCRLCRSRSY